MRNITWLVLVIWLWASPALGHGVEGYIAPCEGFRVSAFYDDGEPMSYAAVEIRAPDAEAAFQTGRTDRNGAFMFHPDRTGTWQVELRDGMGHHLALDIDVVDTDNAAKNAVRPPLRTAGGRSSRLVAGVAIIFGLTGLLFGWKARRANRRII